MKIVGVVEKTFEEAWFPKILVVYLGIIKK